MLEVVGVHLHYELLHAPDTKRVVWRCCVSWSNLQHGLWTYRCGNFPTGYAQAVEFRKGILKCSFDLKIYKDVILKERGKKNLTASIPLLWKWRWWYKGGSMRGGCRGYVPLPWPAPVRWPAASWWYKICCIICYVFSKINIMLLPNHNPASS